MAVSAKDEGDDGALVLAVQRGDVDAFAELFRRHYPGVRRACANRLFDGVEADEVAQAAFVRAFERIDQCAGDRRFGAWVHVIARSLCFDAFRARARVEVCEEPLAGGREHRPNEPEESVLRGERAAQVRQALAALPDRQRRAVIARDWEELRPGEIAERLGLTVGAVDSLVLRARRRLALSYSRLAGESGGGASSITIRSAAATVAVALAVGPHALLAGTGAAAHAVQDTAGRAMGGVMSAVVAVALTLGGVEAPEPTKVGVRPLPVTTVAPVAGGQEPGLPPQAQPPPAETAPGASVVSEPADASTAHRGAPHADARAPVVATDSTTITTTTTVAPGVTLTPLPVAVPGVGDLGPPAPAEPEPVTPKEGGDDGAPPVPEPGPDPVPPLPSLPVELSGPAVPHVGLPGLPPP